MTTFYLVRHAHANWESSENRSLSESGLAKAQHVAELLHSYSFDHIYASPYRRAVQTVEPLAERLNLPIQILDDLRERQLAGEPLDRVDDFDKAIKAVWRAPNFSHPGGESNIEAQHRGAALIPQLEERHPDGHVVLGTHGNLMALILQHFDPTLGYDFWKALSMPDIYRLTPSEEALLTRLWAEPASR